MPRKPKSPSPPAPLAPLPPEVLDQIVRGGPLSAEELDDSVRRFKKAVIERALGGDLTHNALESVHARLRKISRPAGTFRMMTRPPSCCGSRCGISRPDGRCPPAKWKAAMHQFAILYDRSLREDA